MKVKQNKNNKINFKENIRLLEYINILDLFDFGKYKSTDKLFRYIRNNFFRRKVV